MTSLVKEDAGPVAKKKTTKKEEEDISEEPIVIDEKLKLVFQSEDEVLEHFEKPVDTLEEEFLKIRSADDYGDDEAIALEDKLEDLLQNPDEVWMDNSTVSPIEAYNYIRSFANSDGEIYYYVAVTYVAAEIPTFIFLHFPTQHESTMAAYRRGEKIFERPKGSARLGGIEGDALSEGDELAGGLYRAMLTLRNDADLEENLFQNYAELREESIEDADEIWRNTTISGYTLVNFIKDFSRYENNQTEILYYISITIEDEATNSHALLFSFPTNDESLVERYRHGENLQADEVV